MSKKGTQDKPKTEFEKLQANQEAFDKAEARIAAIAAETSSKLSGNTDAFAQQDAAAAELKAKKQAIEQAKQELATQKAASIAAEQEASNARTNSPEFTAASKRWTEADRKITNIVQGMPALEREVKDAEKELATKTTAYEALDKEQQQRDKEKAQLHSAQDKLKPKIQKDLTAIAERKQALEALEGAWKESAADLANPALVAVSKELEDISTYLEDKSPTTPDAIAPKLLQRGSKIIGKVQSTDTVTMDIEKAIEDIQKEATTKQQNATALRGEQEKLQTLQAALQAEKDKGVARDASKIGTLEKKVVAQNQKIAATEKKQQKDQDDKTKANKAALDNAYSSAIMLGKQNVASASLQIQATEKLLAKDRGKIDKLQAKLDTFTLNAGSGLDHTSIKSIKDMAQAVVEIKNFKAMEKELEGYKEELATAKEEVKIISHATELGVTIDEAKVLLNPPDIPTQTREERVAEERSDIAEMDRQRQAAGIRPRARPTTPPMSAQDARDVEEYERQRSVAAEKERQPTPAQLVGKISALTKKITTVQEKTFDEFAKRTFSASGRSDIDFTQYKKDNFQDLKAASAKDVDYKRAVHAEQQPLFTKIRRANKLLPKISWEAAEIGEAQIKTLKDASGKKICSIKSTNLEEEPPLKLTTALGLTLEVKSRRELELPRTLEAGQGPRTMNFVLKGADGNNMNKEDAVYLAARYGKDGKLTSVVFPEPVEFSGEGKDAVAFFEVNGQAFTLPVNRGELEGLQQEVAKNRSLEASRAAERETEAPGMPERGAPAPEAERGTHIDGVPRAQYFQEQVDGLNTQERDALAALKAASKTDLAEAETKYSLAQGAFDAAGRDGGTASIDQGIRIRAQAALQEVEAKREIDAAIQQATLGGDRVDVALVTGTLTGDALTKLSAIKEAKAAAVAELNEQIAADQQAAREAEAAAREAAAPERTAEARKDLEGLAAATEGLVEATVETAGAAATRVGGAVDAAVHTGAGAEAGAEPAKEARGTNAARSSARSRLDLSRREAQVARMRKEFEEIKKPQLTNSQSPTPTPTPGKGAGRSSPSGPSGGM